MTSQMHQNSYGSYGSSASSLGRIPKVSYPATSTTQQYQQQSQLLPPPPPPGSYQSEPASQTAAPYSPAVGGYSSYTYPYGATASSQSSPLALNHTTSSYAGASRLGTTANERQRSWPHLQTAFRGKPAGVVSKVTQQKRKNFQIKQVLRPKNAINALQELAVTLKAGVCFGVPDRADGNDDPFPYKTTVKVFEKEYAGCGVTVSQARKNAAENALKALILERIPTLTSQSETSQSERLLSSGTTYSSAEDETAWGIVGAFAMHKLLSEYGVDSMTANGVTVIKQQENGLNLAVAPRQPARQLPSNPQSLHPVTLITTMKPESTFSEPSGVGTEAVTVTLVVDNLPFNGTGGNKKAARKDAAEKAAKKLWGIKYES